MKRMPAQGRTCSFPDCGRHVFAKSLCWTHYRQMRATGLLRPIGYRRETARLKKEYASEFNWWRYHRSRLPKRLHDFKTFVDEVGPKPTGWNTVKRVDGRYKWQPTGKRLIKYKGQSLTQNQWAKQLGITRQALSLRLKKQKQNRDLSKALVSGSQSGTGRDQWRSDRRQRRAEIAAAVRSGRDPEEVAKTYGVSKTLVLLAVRETRKSRRPPGRPIGSKTKRLSTASQTSGVK